MSFQFKSFVTIIIICTYIFLTIDTVAAEKVDLSSVTAASYVLMDADSGKVLISRLPHQKLPPASTTKLMTMLLTLEAIDQGKVHKSDRVTASQKAAEMDGSRIYLEKGEVMSLDDLLKSMALASANDASVAVAEKISGSEADFVVQMNTKAREIGMKDSHFENVSGMPSSNHYSSAYDLALLAQYTLARTGILQYTALKQHTLRNGTFPIYNGNKLLWRYDGADGLKNGYTSEAKNCLIATAKRGRLRLIVVVLGCSMRGSQTSDATNLLDYGFDKYAAANLVPGGEVCGTVKVKTGKVKEVAVVLPDELNAIYAKSEGIHFTRRQDLPKSVPAPVKQGQKLGQMQIFANDKLLKTVDLIAADNVERLSLPGRIIHMHWSLKLILLLIVSLFYARHRIRKNGGYWNRPKTRINHFGSNHRDYRY
ncbi:MAG: D-alanyl-D-alanine carboxypeptidase [Syntrophomonadaceae bacterium]|nr:D-alanyl-D-alanine carboxypeptidase [Syntrophomonadaceae bacterium]